MFAQEYPLVGEWSAYLSHNLGVQTGYLNGTVYAISGGGLFTYDDATQATRTYSTVDGLSGVKPTTLHINPTAGLVFLGYEDGTVDYFRTPDKVSYLTDIRRNDFYTQKQINAIASTNDRLFLATGFGLVVYNLDTRLPIADIAQFANNPSRLEGTSVAVFQDTVYVTLENNRIFRAALSVPVLRDPTVWSEVLPDASGVDKMYQVAANSGALFARGDSGIYEYQNGTWTPVPTLKGKMGALFAQEDAVLTTQINTVYIYLPGVASGAFLLSGGVASVTKVGDVYFAATVFEGFQRFENFVITNFTPDGPVNNECIRIAAGNSSLYVAPRGYDQQYTPRLAFDGIYYYGRISEKWTNYNNSTGTLPFRVATDFARAYYDRYTETAYLGSWGRGIVAMKDGAITEIIDCRDGLSTLDGVCDTTKFGNTRISGLAVDEDEQLWVTNFLAASQLQVRTPDGQWVSFPSNKFPSGFQAVDLVIDNFGSKWMINRRDGIVVFQDNRTPSVFTDDKVVVLRNGVGQGSLPSTIVNDLAVDADGFVWVATALGVAVYYDVGNIAAGRVVEANTPFFQGRALLKDLVVNTIAVDGGNRKWIGTNAGVFLVGEDGNEVVNQFTESNSPLPSNEIYDISVDGTTGEVFIATSAGIVSFLGDATDAPAKCNDVSVYPNPVRPDYDGPIRIVGSAFASKIKIVTPTGRLVRELDSQGGTAVWDGLDLRGQRVTSGIYLALIANANGDNGCIGKFSVITR